jgi:mannitol 2-dehydrogenase
LLRLNQDSLAALPSHVETPRYDPKKLVSGVAHFGVGAFHRAHQAMALHELLNLNPRDSEALKWGVCGIGLLKSDDQLCKQLRTQDHFYTLVNKGTDRTSRTRLIGSLTGYQLARESWQACIDTLASPNTRIVSFTITEGGYNKIPSTGEFDFGNPLIVQEMVPDSPPVTVYGYLSAALESRKKHGLPGLTLMSCDNVQNNGGVLREMLREFIGAKHPKLWPWIEENVSFPNTMVDGITPVLTKSFCDEVSDELGLIDEAPVLSEDYFQWVIEDNFTQGRPEFERVGCLMVKNVMPFELMKLRLLNLSHQALAYFGYLMGYRFVHEAASDELLQALLSRYMREEAMLTLEPITDFDVDSYQKNLIIRFQNPFIADTISRLCAYTSDRIPQWLVPVIKHQLNHEGSIRFAAAIIASWARYAEGTDEQGTPIQVVDSQKDLITQLAQRSKSEAIAFLKDVNLFGDLADSQRFVREFTMRLEDIRQNGTKVALGRLLSD